MSDELISIVVTLYNYKRFIKDLLESVVNQTYTNWELIIVDDGSTDNPMSVIKPYMKRFGGRIIYIKHDENKGYAAAKNTGIINSYGDFIVMIDADDMLTEKSLEIRKKLLDDNPDKLWCHGQAHVTDERAAVLSPRSAKFKKNYRQQLVWDGWDLTKQYCHRLIHAQGVMVRKEFHKLYGLYDETLRGSADNEMWRRAIRFGEIPAHTEKYVAVYRIHPARMSRSVWKMAHIRELKRYIIDVVEKRFKEGINDANTKLWK